ncbi:MAG TPA: xanthine dehydrogenase family protein subunit M [Gemmatimonadaceae bacterium]|nr:xanthine dehydrogenase family protein subunit M [Gemmatimonadaceae bacterium]
MYPASFEYHRATSVDDALGMLQRYGEDAKLIAGGHSLLPLMKLRLSTPTHLIDIRRIAGLSGVRENGGGVIVGATTTHSEVAASNFVRAKLPLLAEAAGGIGDPLVRNMGTIGGSLAHADPKADYPAVVLALRANVVVVGKSGKDSMESDKTFTGMFTTAVQASEMITEVHFPVSGSGNGGAYEKLADPASGYATVGVAAQLKVEGGTVTSAGVALTGFGPKATRLSAVEAALKGKPATADTVRAAAKQAALPGVTPYQANLACVYAERALIRALERATAK